MTTRRRLAAKLAIVFALALLAPGLASAASGQNPVIVDCLAHPSGLTGRYTVSQLTHALNAMSPETKEYTSCPDVISRARLAAIGGVFTGPGTSSSGSFLPTPVIVILVLLVLAAVTFGAIAIRRRQAGSATPGEDPPVGGDGPQAPDA